MPRPKPLTRHVSSARAVAYVRVSTEEQDLGTDAQRASIEAWSSFNKIRILGWFEDRLTGTTPIEDRPGLCAALDMLERAGAEWLVVSHRDRVSREMLLTMLLERTLGKLRAGLITSSEAPAQEITPEVVLQRQLLDAIAQYEKAQIGRRTKAALQALKARGAHLGQPSYRHSGRGQIIRRKLWQLHDEGLGYRSIAQKMNQDGLCTLHGCPWDFKNVQRIMRHGRPSKDEPVLFAENEKVTEGEYGE